MNSLIKDKKAIVLDWDGTIADTMKYKRLNFIELLSSFVPEKSSIEQFHREYSGIPRRTLMRKCVESLSGKLLCENELEDLSNRYTQMNMSSSKSASPFEDASAFLDYAKGKFLLFVSSSSDPSELLEVAKNMNLTSFFDEILGSRPGFGKGKEHICYLKEKYQLIETEFIFFGDDLKDYELNHAAGVETFLVNRDDKYLEVPTISTFRGILSD